jgi:para-aminobenzoate synthetase component 1
MDSNDYPQQHSSFDCVVAVDAFTSIKQTIIMLFEFKTIPANYKRLAFGYLSYDLKMT